MRPAAVLGDIPSCSRRAPSGLLRSHQCQPGRSGRLARVVPATAPTSSPTNSGSSAQSTTIPAEPTGQPRNGSGQVTVQQPTLPQKPPAAAATAQSHVAPAAPGATVNLAPAAPGPASSPLSSPGPNSDASRAVTPQTTGAAGAPAPPSAGSAGSPTPSPLPQQPPTDSRVVPTPAAQGRPDAVLAGTLLPAAGVPAPGAGAPLGNGSGNNISIATSLGSSHSNGSASPRSPSPQPATPPPTSKLNGSPGVAKPAAAAQPGSSGGDAGPAAAAASPPASPSGGKQAGPSTSAQATSPAAAPPSQPSSPAPAAAAGSPASASGSWPSSANSGASPPPSPGVPGPGQQAPSSPGPSGSGQQQAAPPSSSAAPPVSTPVASGSQSPSASGPAAATTAPGLPATPGSPAAPSAGQVPPPSSAGAPGSPAGAAQATSAAPQAPPSPSTTSTSSSSTPSAAPAPASPTPASAVTAGAPAAAPTAAPAPAGGGGAAAAPISSASSGFQLRPIHVVIFAAIFLGGALFAAFTLQFTAELDFQDAVATVYRRVVRSVAFRQLCVIAGAICLVRFGLNNVLRALAKFSANPVQWDKSKVYYILKEVYQPLELLLFIAAICTIADSFVPQLIAVPRSTVHTVVRSTLSVSFIIGAATVVFNLKSRFCKENAWQSEMNGDVTAQRRWEAYDKLGTFVIYTITFVLGIQALGLEVTSVLAIGGIGGLAIGLAGREICENILNGFLIMSTSPFEVGDEVHFFHSSKVVEGMVLDIGWYRTTIRSYEREVFVIPNAVFSKNIVLNITRKNREWRFFEMICVRVQDVHKVNAIIQDIRRIVRNDQRIITKLHRRIFLDKLTHEDCRIYVSFYVEAQNRESFMAAKQDLLLAFVDCVERNGAKLAVPRTTVQMEPEVVDALSPMLGAAAAMAAAKVTMDVQQAAGNAAAAAARAITDGRTITAEVTAVPSASSGGSTAASGGTTATSGKAAATPTTTTTVATASTAPGSPGKTAAGGGSGSGSTTTDVAAGASGGGGAAAAAQPPSGQGSSKGGGTGVTWLLSKLAQVLFET